MWCQFVVIGESHVPPELSFKFCKNFAGLWEAHKVEYNPYPKSYYLVFVVALVLSVDFLNQ